VRGGFLVKLEALVLANKELIAVKVDGSFVGEGGVEALVVGSPGDFSVIVVFRVPDLELLDFLEFPLKRSDPLLHLEHFLLLSGLLVFLLQLQLLNFGLRLLDQLLLLGQQFLVLFELALALLLLLLLPLELFHPVLHRFDVQLQLLLDPYVLPHLSLQTLDYLFVDLRANLLNFRN